MLSQFKKTVLSVTMLGCAFGMQAEEKKESSASSLKTALASAAIIAGGYLFNDTRSLNMRIGCALAGIPALYLLSSAKGTKAKLYSLCGSLNLFAGGVNIANLLWLIKSKTIVGVVYGPLMAAARIVGGYLLQPEETEQGDKAEDIA